MDWIEIGVQADGESAEAVVELFNRLNSRADGTGGAVTEVAGFDPVGEDHRPIVTVRTYLPDGEPGLEERRRRIEEGLWHLGRIHPLGEVVVRRLAEVDWANAWKAGYRPIRIGRSFLVVPAWQVDDTPAGPSERLIVLDPGMAFGTGLHPSTQLCLAASEQVIEPGARVLDAGCGSGILTIGAARLGAASVDAFDIDEIAVRATCENIALNSLETPIAVYASSGPGDGELWGAAGSPARWDVILVNILPHVIAEMLQRGVADHLAPGGRMVLAGIIEARQDEVRAGLESCGLRVTTSLRQDDWVALVAQRDETQRGA
jgi:ribosomal protein L11 methyltransferase